MSTPSPNPIPPPDALAVALSKLDPAPHGFDRDALMFAAGQASKWWLLTLWRTVAAAAIVAAGVFATLYFTRPTKIEFVEPPAMLQPSR